MNGVHFGRIANGDRLPSARQLSAELGADARVVTAAYEALEREGIVTRRPGARGFFASIRRASTGRPIPSAEWLVSVLADTIGHGISVRQFTDFARSSLESVHVHTTCLECNDDQLRWLCGELEDDYGFVTHAVDTRALRNAVDENLQIERSDILVTTSAHASEAKKLGDRLHKPVVLVTLKPEIIAEVTELLSQGPLYFLCTDPRFVTKIKELYAAVENRFNIRTVLLGRDDPNDIPSGAPVWVMRRASEQLGGVPAHIRPLNTARIFSPETRKELLSHLVRANKAASAALRSVD
jgi:DNA-binding transcriptional regulator YhcF (GntR family)